MSERLKASLAIATWVGLAWIPPQLQAQPGDRAPMLFLLFIASILLIGPAGAYLLLA